MNQESTKAEEVRIRGVPISEGIGIGISVFLGCEERQDIPEFPISIGEVDNEIARYQQARLMSQKDLKQLQHNLREEGAGEAASIIGTHIQMLDDPLIISRVETKIRETLKNTETVFRSVIAEYERRFKEANVDNCFYHKLDVQDLTKRVLQHLSPQRLFFHQVPQDAIIFSKELAPSDIAAVDASHIGAFVTESGGGTAHSALIARSRGIPYVSNIPIDVTEKNVKKGYVIVDGQTGDVILNPSIETLSRYTQLKNRIEKQYKQLGKDNELVAETCDGYRIDLYANINHLEDLKSARDYGAIGVGLYRSEYLFLQNPSLLFDEEGQAAYYKQMFELSKKTRLTFRVMDLGGDKGMNLFHENSKESKTLLEYRGIRFLLKYPEMFKIQLRAILRAGFGSQVRILLPLITDMGEFLEVKRMIHEVKWELSTKKIEHVEDPFLGCMLEVPSAVLICDTLAQESDFLALGTNDLAQYTLGIDRKHPQGASFHYPTHPGLIRMIRMTILEAKRHSKSVTICGEMASDPLFTALLIGLGVQQFSCAPRFIPIIKRAVRKLSLLNAMKVAEQVLNMTTSVEIFHYLNEQIIGTT